LRHHERDGSDQPPSIRLSAHYAAFWHTDRLAIDNRAGNRRPDNRTHDATSRHADRLAINHGMGWPSNHGDTGERYQRD
jgi:hypothetical protein